MGVQIEMPKQMWNHPVIVPRWISPLIGANVIIAPLPNVFQLPVYAAPKCDEAIEVPTVIGTTCIHEI